MNSKTRKTIKRAGSAKSVRLYSINELLEEFSISRPTMNRLIYGGFLKTIRVGRTIRIPESAALEFIENGGERNIKEPK